MTLAKTLANRIAPEDAKHQCAKDPRCHRKDGHDGRCQSLGVVMLRKVRDLLRGKR
jgi:hypothetical protein